MPPVISNTSTDSQSVLSAEEINRDAVSDNNISTTKDILERQHYLGDIIAEFLEYFGEEFESGRHGFSVREGGFRFSVQGKNGQPPHPQVSAL